MILLLRDTGFIFKNLDAHLIYNNMAAYRDIVSWELLRDFSLGPEMTEYIANVKPSIIDRFENNVRKVIYGYEPPKTETILTCFKVSHDTTVCSYAHLYSCCDEGIRHMYYTCCPTYSSQDGEYRHRVTQYKDLTKLYDMFPEVLEAAETVITKYMEMGKLEFDVMFCFPFGCNADVELFKQDINMKRFAIKFFAMAWLADTDAYKHNYIENHINPAYEHILGVIDRKLHDDIMAMLDEHKYHELLACLSGFVRSKFNIHSGVTEVGQKFFPLTHREILSSGDLFFPTWHELTVGDMCSDLVVNLISPSFPAAGSWTLIQNVTPEVYDNVAMKDKYSFSDRSGEIVTQLKLADRMNYVESHREKGYINGQFHNLSKNINKSIEFAESNIRLTDVLLCGFGEYAGRTYRDIPALAQNMKHTTQKVYRAAICDYVHLKRHIFELIYSMWCMNTKLHVMHGDLHINNMTLHISHIMSPKILEKAHVAYIVEDEVYRFRHDFAYSCIIDFSRAVYADEAAISEAFGADYARRYLKTQTYRVLGFMSKYLPRFFTKFKKSIMDAAFFDKFPLFFKVATIMDPYCVATNMMSLLLTYKDLDVDPQIPKLLSTIAHEAETMLVNMLKDIFVGKLKSPDDIEWPCLTLLRKIFVDDKFGPEDIAGANSREEVLADVFNSNNSIKYSLRDRSNLGPLVGYELQKKSGESFDKTYLPRESIPFNPETEKVLTLSQKYVNPDAEYDSDDGWI
jgi:hypothetical protein